MKNHFTTKHQWHLLYHILEAEPSFQNLNHPTKSHLFRNCQVIMATHQNYPQGPQATFVSVPLLNNSSQSEKERINKLFPIKTILGLSIAQLIFAGLGAATQVILFYSSFLLRIG